MRDISELRRRAEAHLVQCGPCDFGLPTSCTCPPGDYRSVMNELMNALPTVDEIRKLSRMLFAAREFIEMWATVVQERTGQPYRQATDLITEIDSYRVSRGWPEYGYGDEVSWSGTSGS